MKQEMMGWQWHQLDHMQIIMAALHSRCGHYIFALSFVRSSFFFPRLISAVADYVFHICTHGVALVQI